MNEFTGFMSHVVIDQFYLAIIQSIGVYTVYM